MRKPIAKRSEQPFGASAMTALPKRYFTPEEYLVLEANADYKSQYVAGEIFATAGAQPEHIEVTKNLIGMLYNRFRGRPRSVYFTDLRVNVHPGNMYTYPDVMALCGEPRFDRTHNPPSLLNPQVIFEVLSPSTATFDRGEKFTRYRTLESLTDYVLLSTERLIVEHFMRQDDVSWRFTEHHESAQMLALASVGCELPLAEIYERVSFPEPPRRGD